MVTVLKTVVGRLTEGSNPSLSASMNKPQSNNNLTAFFYIDTTHKLSCYNYIMNQENSEGTTPEMMPDQSLTSELVEDNNHSLQEMPADENDSTIPISWKAIETVPQTRGVFWYISFSVAVIALMALAIFVFKSISFAMLIPVMAAAVILLTTRKQHDITYSISSKGVYVGDKLHDFSEFRGFGVIQDNVYPSVILLPVQRFSPGLTLYFDESMGESIVDILGARLPMQEVKPDSLEKLIRLIKL